MSSWHWMSSTVLLALVGAGTAHADNVARSDELFAEGKALMETDLHGGCKKLDEALALNPQAVGTLLNVALCDVRLGKLATAAEHFERARDMAREQGMNEHLEAAEAHLVALQPRIPRVTFTLAEMLPDTSIVVGGRLLPSTGWADVPLDPGEHRIVITAPGRVAFRTTLRLAEGERQEIVVPKLATSSGRPAATLTLAAGAALVAAGVVVGFVSARRYDAALEDCIVRGGVTACDDAAYDDITSARTLGNVGTVVGVVGVVTASVGAYLWLRKTGRQKESTVSVVPQVGVDGGGVAAVGRF
ncbi:MAG: tetratricopeptide repeat protein [Kofleriaceae bacterium]|nr:tetratricopeptide repeat protein [Kofleriaceae bacterium]